MEAEDVRLTESEWLGRLSCGYQLPEIPKIGTPPTARRYLFDGAPHGCHTLDNLDTPARQDTVSGPDSLPAQMVNEYVYCPRLAYLKTRTSNHLVLPAFNIHVP